MNLSALCILSLEICSPHFCECCTKFSLFLTASPPFPSQPAFLLAAPEMLALHRDPHTFPNLNVQSNLCQDLHSWIHMFSRWFLLMSQKSQIHHILSGLSTLPSKPVPSPMPASRHWGCGPLSHPIGLHVCVFHGHWLFSSTTSLSRVPAISSPKEFWNPCTLLYLCHCYPGASPHPHLPGQPWQLPEGPPFFHILKFIPPSARESFPKHHQNYETAHLKTFQLFL